MVTPLPEIREFTKTKIHMCEGHRIEVRLYVNLSSPNAQAPVFIQILGHISERSTIRTCSYYIEIEFCVRF